MNLAVLDANVLFPNYLRDTLLTLAEQGLFAPVWSDEILDETRRNVLRTRENVTEEKMDRTISLMNAAFEDALVERDAIEPLVDSKQNDEKDRHVLATAVARGASGIVTANAKHFRAAACDPYGITVTTPDEFLMVLFDIDRDLVCDALRARIERLSGPEMTLAEVLVRLEEGQCNEFAKALSDRLGIQDELKAARIAREEERAARAQASVPAPEPPLAH